MIWAFSHRSYIPALKLLAIIENNYKTRAAVRIIQHESEHESQRFATDSQEFTACYIHDIISFISLTFYLIPRV